MTPSLRLAFTLALFGSAASAQVGVLDQSNAFPPAPPIQTASFNGSAPSLEWQQEVRCGAAGVLEGFLLYLNGTVGSTMDVRVRVGAGWNTGPIAFQGVATKTNSNFNEIVFVDCSSAAIALNVNDVFVIEIQGNNSGGGLLGSYSPPPGAPSYPNFLYLGPNASGCFTDCGWRISFETYMIAPVVPTAYCTAGTTTNGCNASISASGQPSVSFANACSINVANVEGQRTGILFYGLQALPQPWCPGGVGSSLLCVKPPTQRSFPQSSGGANATCTGSFSLDWNAFQMATPGALGAPFSAGDKVYAQAWFRDPGACRTTSLSNGLELTYTP